MNRVYHASIICHAVHDDFAINCISLKMSMDKIYFPESHFVMCPKWNGLSVHRSEINKHTDHSPRALVQSGINRSSISGLVDFGQARKCSDPFDDSSTWQQVTFEFTDPDKYLQVPHPKLFFTKDWLTLWNSKTQKTPAFKCRFRLLVNCWLWYQEIWGHPPGWYWLLTHMIALEIIRVAKF